MSTRPVSGRSLVASALSAAADWLVESAEASDEGDHDHPAPPEAHPVVAVVGLSGRCGTTTVARAVGAQLGAREPGGGCAVTAAILPGAVPLGMPAAARLAREVAPFIRGSVRTCGRLCLIEDPNLESVVAAVRYLAPLVIDVDTRTEGAAAAAVADHVVLVGSPSTEPALAALLGQTLRAVGPEPVTVLNRTGPDGERWTGRAELELPDSRMGARVALAGREPRGVLGRAVSELTARCGSAC